MSALSELKSLLLNWDGHFESAEALLLDTRQLLAVIQEQGLVEEEIADAQWIIQEYKKLLAFLQKEKSSVQREASRMNQSNQKVRDYVRFNQSSGFEFYY
ncbi:MAG TPA: hypothetical protein IAA20_04530 [Candidatus Enterococcus avicola]|uniref:Uncharacterized protein n=1 Tax=Candidatus Enterococcus avicola TaxID=2838561 RepID=A0A9D2JH34_9ENTE|nr:hypothetical protein [Candidatus Enterococcus avicola]